MGLPWAVALLASTLWIVYRVYLVFQKPVEDLEEILGIDIPPVPDVSLSSITSTSVLLYWKPPESYHSPLRLYIQINGITIEEVDRSDGSVQLTGLQPGYFYGIRAIATNASENSSYSRLIQVQTVPEDGPHGLKLLASTEQSPAKRAAPSHRISHTISSIEHAVPHSESDGAGQDDTDSEETVAKLTKKLDTLRRQKEVAERQLAEEIDDAEASRTALTLERDNLKRLVEEKERSSLEFRKQVKELEGQCKSAQRRKAAKERVLQQKKAERQKMKDEIEKWVEENEELREETVAMEREKTELEEQHLVRIAEAQGLMEEAQAESKALEEEIRDWGMRIKVLEEGRKKADEEQNEEEQEAERREKEDDQVHETKMQDLQNQYTTLFRLIADTEEQARQTQEHLNYLLNMKAKNPAKFVPIAGLDYDPAPIPPSQRRSRPGISRNQLTSNPSHSYMGSNSGINSVSSLSPAFSSNAFPFFGAGSHVGSVGRSSISEQEVDALTGGAPMSPTANNLLPSNLLGDDDFPTQFHSRPKQLSANSSLAYRSPNTEAHNQDPQSPLSAHSQSPSLLSSPRESLTNIHSFFPGREQANDNERQSLASTGSPYSRGLTATSTPAHPRRISDLFGFARPRGKSSLNDLPVLGSLKSSQTQSYPSNLDHEAPPTHPNKRAWPNPMASLRTRGAGNVENSIPDVRVALPRKARRGMFGSKLDPSEPLDDRSSSPRPSSTYSYEHPFRSSSDHQPFSWAAQDSIRQGGSPLGANWSSGGMPWSHNQSRRQSLQHGSTSNLSIGSTPLDPDDYSSPYGAKASQPAPIGTERFRFSQRSNAPKLNPAAPSFTTRLFSRNDAKKTPKHEKSYERLGDKTTKPPKDTDKQGRDNPEPSLTSTNSSPRLSRDTHSITTSASLDPITEPLELSVSSTQSEANGPPSATSAASAAPKESLMQRLTRKGSSSKFAASWKERGSIFSSSKKGGDGSGTPGIEGEEDQAGSDYLGRSWDGGSMTPNSAGAMGADREGGGGKRGSLSWSRVMGKKGKAKGEVSESEVGEDDE